MSNEPTTVLIYDRHEGRELGRLTPREFRISLAATGSTETDAELVKRYNETKRSYGQGERAEILEPGQCAGFYRSHVGQEAAQCDSCGAFSFQHASGERCEGDCRD